MLDRDVKTRREADPPHGRVFLSGVGKVASPFCPGIVFDFLRGGVRDIIPWPVVRSFSMLRMVNLNNIEVVDDQLAEVLRRKSPAEKVEMVAAANRTARLLAAAGIRYQHPEWDNAQVQNEVIRRVTGGTK